MKLLKSIAKLAPLLVLLTVSGCGNDDGYWMLLYDNVPDSVFITAIVIIMTIAFLTLASRLTNACWIAKA